MRRAPRRRTRADALKAAYDEIEDQEDEHLYHTKGWCRELWIQSLGLNAVLPPPEERRHVKTAIGAAKAEQAAEKARSLTLERRVRVAIQEVACVRVNRYGFG